MMRPGEPPTKDASRIIVSRIIVLCFKERYDLSAVGRMKFNSRVGS